MSDYPESPVVRWLRLISLVLQPLPMKIEHVEHWKWHPRSLNTKMNILKTWNSTRNAYTKASRSMVCWTVVFHEERSILPFFLNFPLLRKSSPSKARYVLGTRNWSLSTNQQSGSYLSCIQFLFFCSAGAWCGSAGSSSYLVQGHL